MKHYSTRTEQAQQLANLVADQLAAAIESHGKAVLVVAGGETPRLFLNYLSATSIGWAKVVVIPSDERWVDSSHSRSNDRFIRDNLLNGNSDAATVVSLYVQARQPVDSLMEINARVDDFELLPSVCVLGMGEDGHIASIFPGADNLKMALSPETKESVIVIQSPGTNETRVSLTLARLLKSEHIHLLISGNEKLATLKKAKIPGDVEQMPVRAILNNDRVQIHFAE